MTRLIELLGHRTIGTVEEVHADRIVALLEPDAPQATALNTGAPSGFPRINGYVLVPHEGGATACIVASVRIERRPFPKRRGTQGDFGLVELPFPSRLMTVTPIGTLKAELERNTLSFKVRRGVDIFPSVGEPVRLPTVDELRAIVQGETEGAKRILLGHCPTASLAPVHVDPDKLFGRHLAVLGNTGAGKSCSVAGLVRWSLEAAKRVRVDQASRQSKKTASQPNARFIILDPNGEYARAFVGHDVRLFRVDPQAPGEPLQVPAWLWNGAEWTAFVEAAPGAQRPILLKALRRLRGGMATPHSFESKVAGTLNPYRNIFRLAHANRDYMRFPQVRSVIIALESATTELAGLASEADSNEHSGADVLRNASVACESAAAAGRRGPRFEPFGAELMAEVMARLDRASDTFGLPEGDELDADLPRWFDARDVPLYVEALAGLMPGRDMAQFVETLNLRIHSLLAGERLKSVIQPDVSPPITLESWLTDYVGADQAENGPVAVVDLSLVPSEVIHIVVSVLARMIFEALQRYRRQNQTELPTTLILEEAHTFVHRDLRGEAAPPAGRECARVFERIAREGRKFGLGLVLASQRPSEVSQTMLSQCNTFLLHRLVNDRDQELVKKLVPDALGPLLRELPSLPTRRAILLGWAAPTPTLVEVQEIQEEFRPHSPDPAFWDVWTGNKDREIDWANIAKVWQRGVPSGSE